jgi:hypothetical protein
MEAKVTRRYHFIPFRITVIIQAKINTHTTNNVARDEGNFEAAGTIIEFVNWQSY